MTCATVSRMTDTFSAVTPAPEAVFVDDRLAHWAPRTPTARR
jgi:hypothetical protein